MDYDGVAGARLIKKRACRHRPPRAAADSEALPLVPWSLNVLVFFIDDLFRRLEKGVRQGYVVYIVHGGIIQHVRVQEKKNGHVDLFSRTETLLFEAEALDFVEIDACACVCLFEAGREGGREGGIMKHQ